VRNPGHTAVSQALLHRPRVVALLAVLAVLAALIQTAITAPPAQAANPNQVDFTLEGCRNDGTIVLPNGSGEYICPDEAYTTGNLQKGWNELDLVPLRVTAAAKAQAPASQNYTIMLAVDARDGGRTGYDLIGGQKVTSTPAMAGNCALTQFPDPNDESTWVDLGQEPREPGFAYPDDPAIANVPVFTIASGGGGVAFGRQYTVAQSRATSCQFDFYARLSLGSSQYPGASLQLPVQSARHQLRNRAAHGVDPREPATAAAAQQDHDSDPGGWLRLERDEVGDPGHRRPRRYLPSRRAPEPAGRR